MPESADYAVLFSGGGYPDVNHSRYYQSLKENYELLLKRGVKSENILIAYAAGVGKSKVGLSPVFDSIVQSEEYDNGLDNFFVKYNLNDNGFRNSFDTLYSNLVSPKNAVEIPPDPRDIVKASDSGKVVTYKFSDNQSLIAFKESIESASSVVNRLSDKSNIRVSVVTGNVSPTELIVDFEVFSKSDLSFATDQKSTVIEATKDSLQKAVGGRNNPSKDTLFGKISENDSLYVWTFDHGSATKPLKEGVNTATLVPWVDLPGSLIQAKDFADIFRGVTGKAKMSTYLFAQCYAGGLLEAMRSDSVLAELNKGNKWFGMSATNQYETSKGTGFADGIAKGLKEVANTKTSSELFKTAFAGDIYSYGTPKNNNNSFEMVYRKEHPWSYGSKGLPIFAQDIVPDGQDLDGVKLLNLESLGDSLFQFADFLDASEDQPLDLFDELRPQFGELSDLSFEGYKPSDYGSIDYDEKSDSLVYTPIDDFSGQDSFVLRFYDGDIFFDIDVDVAVASVNDAPMAVDDFVQISSGVRDVLINVDDQPGFLDDTDVDGDELSIASYSAPVNGTIEKVGDFLFEYQPNSGFIGSDSFLYVVSDGEAFDVAEVLISVVDSSL